MNTTQLIWLALATAAGNAAAEDGNFIQYDRTGSGNTVVAVHATGDWQVGGSYSQWSDTGKSLSASLTRRVQTFALADSTLQLRLGATALRHEGDTGNASALGLKVAAEHFASGRWGQSYSLVEAASAFKSWLGVLQYTPANSPLGVEWSAVGDDRWYVGHRLALRYAIAGTPWSLRAGRQLDGSNTVFIGISYNRF